MMKKSWSSLCLGIAATLLVAISGAGCGSPGATINPNVLKNPPKTWISLSPGTSEFMSVLNSHLIGRTASDDFPVSIKSLPIVANVKPDYEMIAKLKPDLIVLDPSLYNAGDLAKLKQLNVPMIQVTGDSVHQFIKSLYALGAATQSETNINDYVEFIRQERAAAEGDPFSQPHNVALLMVSPDSNPMIAETGSFYDDLIRCAAGNPVGPTGNQFVTIDPEALMKLNPDIIVVAAPGGNYNVLLKDPRFAGLAAVKDKHVIGIDPDLVLRRGDRVNTAIKELHQAMGSLLRSH